MIINKWSERLIKKGIDVLALKKDIEVNKMAPLQRKMKLKELHKEANQLELDTMELMGVFDIFKKEDNIVDNNPLVYLCFLLVGLFFLMFSLLFIAHTVLSTQGFYIIIESVFSGVASLSTVLSLFVFIIFNVFVGLAIVNGSFQMLKPLGSLLGIKPMKLNQTWTNTFLTNNNIMMCAMIGSIIYFMKYCPNYFRFLKAELQFNKLVIRLSVVDPIYAYNIPEYAFLLFAIVALFVMMFEKSPKAIMAQRVEEEKIKLEEERERAEGKKDDKEEKKDE
jgi:LMBR1 domain-containing protein 1